MVPSYIGRSQAPFVFRNVMLVGAIERVRWLSSQVAVCVAGVGKCASLKVRKCANPAVFHSKSEATGSRKLVV